MPGNIPRISPTSLWRSWKAVRKELKNSSIRDVVDFLEYDVDPDVWINRLLASISQGTYEPQPPRRFTLGKSKGFSRTMALPAVPDLVLYRALTDYIFEKAQKRQRRHVYFLRSQHAEVQRKIAGEPVDPAQLGIPHYRASSQRSFLNWLKYDQYRKHLIFKKVHRYFVITDVANFFDSVLHSHVDEALQGLAIPTRTVGLLSFLLERLSIRQDYAGSHGISLPVDEFDCSRTLAHIVLFPHDDEMVRIVGEQNYIRWMDDQNMGVPSKAAGLELLANVGRSLARLHLTPNSQKSKILSLSEARRHFHLDLNRMLDAGDETAKLIGKQRGMTKTLLRLTVTAIWQKAKPVEGQGEFGKVLKRLYRLAGLAGARFFRRRAVRDVLDDPSLAERVADYMRCTGTVTEYLDFVEGLLTHKEQVYPCTNLVLVESLLRVEATGPPAARIRRLGSRLLRRELRIPGAEDCCGIAPLILLRFGDRRSLPLLRRAFVDAHRREPSVLIRSAAIVYASYGIDQFREVRNAASKLLRNNLSETIRFLEEIRRYSEVPNRYKARLSTAYDSVCGLRFVDMRTILMTRLLILNHSKKVRNWVDHWKAKVLAEPISAFDRRLIRRSI